MSSNLQEKNKLRQLTSIILDQDKPAQALRDQVLEMIAILSASQNTEFATSTDYSSGETRTQNGLALSPAMAGMCGEDFVRTTTFLRGTYAAITDVRKSIPGTPAEFFTRVVDLMHRWPFHSCRCCLQRRLNSHY